MTDKIDVRVPDALLAEMRAIGKLAGLSVESVMKFAIATQIRQWEHDKAVRVERDTAVDALRQIASGKRRTREQRLAVSCVTFLDEIGNAA